MSYDWSPKNKVKPLSAAFTPWEEGNEYVRDICVALKPQIEQKIGQQLDGEFEVAKFRKQCLLGTTYVIKLDIGDDVMLDVRVLERIVNGNQALTLNSARWPAT